MTDYTLNAEVGALTLTGYDAGISLVLSASCAETVAGVADMRFASPATAADTAASADAGSYTVYLGATINEIIGATDGLSPNMIMGVTAAEVSAVLDALSVTYPQTVAEIAASADAVAIIAGVVVAERIGILDELTAALKYAVTAAETALAVDAIFRYLGESIAETISSVDAVTLQRYVYDTAAETAGVTDAGTATLIFSLSADETASVADADVLNMIFSATAAETVSLAGGLLQNGTFTAFATNTRTGAVTEYSNFNFNSFARLGTRYIAASDSGLYELTGSDDAGADIVSKIRSGYTQFYGSHLTNLDVVYLGLRGDGDYYVKVITEGSETTYQVRSTSMKTTKVRVGRGVRARYFAFELENVGGVPFDLDSIEFVPLVAKRRI